MWYISVLRFTFSFFGDTFRPTSSFLVITPCRTEFQLPFLFILYNRQQRHPPLIGEVIVAQARLHTIKIRGVGRGPLGHAPLPLGAEGALCDCLAPSNCECFLQGKCTWRAPEGALQRWKVPLRPSGPKNSSEKSLQWRPYSALLGWSGALLALVPPHDFPNTLLNFDARKSTNILFFIGQASYLCS